MARMSNPTHIKVTATPQEVAAIDDAIIRGYGTSRADLCRKALIIYLNEQKSECGKIAEA